MKILCLLAAVVISGGAGADLSYPERVARTLEAAGGDMGVMGEVADKAAERLAAGGALWAAGQPSMVSELCGRAGGFMMIRSLGAQAPAEGDVVLYTPEPEVAVPEGLTDTKALVVCFGPGSRAEGFACFSNHAGDFDVSPTLANAIPAWLFTGELVAALTRLGKMPVMYESIGAYGGYSRMDKYKRGEIAFHDDVEAPPVEAGVFGLRFIEIMAGKLRRIAREEAADMKQAAAWACDAREQGKTLYMYSMGHLFPDEVGKTAIGEMFKSGVWNAGFRHHAKPGDTFEAGDAIVLIGYQHPPDVLLERAQPVGARVAYVTVRPLRDYVDAPGVAWIDPMWDWPDACVPVEGYDVPILPASGILNGAIAWEIYRLASGEGQE